MPHIKRRAMAFLALIVLAIFVLFVALILLMTRPAWADSSLPDGVTCELVREKVAEHGRAAAIAWAIEHGLSIRQIWQIRRTCKV
jgi:hypothetical protein